MKKGTRHIKGRPPQLITSCDMLMLDKFITCLVTENYSALVIYGEPSSTELEAAWNGIMCEYAELIGSDHYQRVVELTREINYAVLKYNKVSLYVFILGIMRSENIARLLRKMGYPGQYDASNLEHYQRELEATLNKAKTLLVSAQRKQTELKKLEAQVEKGKTDRRHFDEMIIHLSSHNKYQIKEHEISVQKYCLMVSAMNRQVELLNAKENGSAYKRNHK